MILSIAFIDWYTRPYLSLGLLYLFPILLGAGYLPRWAIVVLGLGCAALSELLSSLDPAGSFFRLAFESLALVGCGLFASELLRKRRLSLEAEERLCSLVETSPAAIVMVNERGIIDLANRAAAELLASQEKALSGHPIENFLPELKLALECDKGTHFRASMQCVGHRRNGETFLAEVWFSTYKEGPYRKLDAIIADLSGDGEATVEFESDQLEQRERTPLTDREVAVLQLVLRGLPNREIATRLEMSTSGVKNTLRYLFAKTEVYRRSQLVRVALERHSDLL